MIRERLESEVKRLSMAERSRAQREETRKQDEIKARLLLLPSPPLKFEVGQEWFQ